MNTTQWFSIRANVLIHYDIFRHKLFSNSSGLLSFVFSLNKFGLVNWQKIKPCKKGNWLKLCIREINQLIYNIYLKNICNILSLKLQFPKNIWFEPFLNQRFLVEIGFILFEIVDIVFT